MKNKFRKFFTLNPRHEDGFTLVELIVVIAILAILGGVAVPAYTGYIDTAHKSNDRVLVGNIIRAVETGSYSYAVQIEDVVQISDSTKLPVGFIVLTQDGCEIMQSASTQVAIAAKENCKIETVTIYKATKDSVVDKYIAGSYDVYLVSEAGTKTICTTHSKMSSIRVWNNESKKDQNRLTNSSEKSYFVESSLFAYPDEGHVDGQRYTDSRYEANINEATGKFETANDVGPIYDALVLAFGEGYDLKLEYDGWNANAIPSFWVNATQTWGNVERLSDMMYSLTSGLGGDLISDAMGIGTYGSSAEVVYAVALAVKDSFADKQAFVDQWATYGQYAETDEKHGGDAFGIDRTKYPGREYYSAMRAAYNNCVGSYVQQHHSAAEASKHAAALSAYGESAGELVGEKVDSDLISGVVDMFAKENFPRQLCRAAFVSEEGKSYLGDAADCEECKSLYEQYVTSGADLIDAAAVYDTFMTAANTNTSIVLGQATDENGKAVNFFDFYEKQLQEYEGMYGIASEKANGRSAIVIQVFFESGKIVCDVAPAEANPRND